MNKGFIRFCTIFAVCAAMSQTLQAKESHIYFGIDHAEYSWDNKAVSGTFSDASGYNMRLGYDFNNILGVEVQYLKPGEFTHNTTSSLNQKFDSGTSLYLRANMRFEHTTVFVLGGGTYLTDRTGSDTGYGLGAGIDFFGTKNAALTLSYQSNYNDTKNGFDRNLSMLTLGFTVYIDPPKFTDRY